MSEDAGIKDLFCVECFALQHAWPIQLRYSQMASKTNDALHMMKSFSVGLLALTLKLNAGGADSRASGK